MSYLSGKIVAAAGVAFAITSSAPASAQNVTFATSPVAVKSCSVAESFDAARFAGPLVFAIATPLTATNVAISYVNTANVAATAVKLVVKDGDYRQTITTKGTFAPGVQIDQTFEAADLVGVTKSANCRVAEVDFADGTAWHSGARDVVNR